MAYKEVKVIVQPVEECPPERPGCFALIGEMTRLILLAGLLVIVYRQVWPHVRAGMFESRCERLAELEIYDECVQPSVPTP